MQLHLVFAGIVSVLVATTSPSEACKRRHQTPFELFDAAAHVAIGTIATVPPELPRMKGRPGPGEAKLTVARALRGPRVAELGVRISDTSCGVFLKAGERVLVFTDADGWPAGAHDGVIRDAAKWEKVIDAWAAAGNDAARAAVLVNAIASGDDALAVEAAAYLVDEPALIAAIDAAGRKRIAAAKVGTNDWSHGFILVRLRDPHAASVVPSWATLAKAIAAVPTFEAEADTGKLADAIERGTPASRFAAFDRCERVRGAKLWRFSRYVQDLDTPKGASAWKALAESCRKGTPVP
jgi:hypothetical protein